MYGICFRYGVAISTFIAAIVADMDVQTGKKEFDNIRRYIDEQVAS